MLQAGRLRVRISIRSLNFFNLPNDSSGTMAVGFTYPLTGMSARYFWEVKRLRRVRLITSPSSLIRLSGKCGIALLSHNS
jgi:hypothetical protein